MHVQYVLLWGPEGCETPSQRRQQSDQDMDGRCVNDYPKAQI